MEPDQVVHCVLVGAMHGISVAWLIGIGSGWDAIHIELRIRSSLGSSGTQWGIGLTWPPGRWCPMLTYPEIARLSDPQEYCRSCVFQFIDILLSQFLTDSFINIILFEVGNFSVRLGTPVDCVRDDCCHLWFGEGWWCLGHYGWLKYITVCWPNIPLQILYCAGNFFQGSWSKIKFITF